MTYFVVTLTSVLSLSEGEEVKPIALSRCVD